MSTSPLNNPIGRRALLGGAAASCIALTTKIAAAAEKAGAVVDVSGEARADARPLATSAPVHFGEKIATGPQSLLGVRLDKGLGLRLGAQGALTVDELTTEGGGKVTLGAGPLLIDRAAPGKRGASVPADDPSLLRITTPYCTVTLGDDARAFVGPSKEFFGVFVDRGSVTVVSGGKRVRLKQGEGTDVRAMASAPTPPARWRAERIRLALDSVRATPVEAPPQTR